MSRATYNNVKRNSVTYEILRKTEPEEEYDNKGRAVAVTEERSTFKANIQPAEGKSILSLPEGEQTKDAKDVWTIEKITHKDRIVYQGGLYSVRNIKFWHTHRVNEVDFGYNKFVAVRTGEDTRKDPDA
jgi:hypothetical protein